MEELGIDMEELESRLYSQVFHSSAENERPTSQQELPPNPNKDFKQAPRYFNLKTISSRRNAQEFIPLASNNSRPAESASHPSRKVFGSRYYEGISTVPNRLMQMINPCNNFVVLPQVSTQIISQNVLPNVRNKNFEKYIGRQHMRELKKIKNMERNKRRREIKRQLKKLQVQEKGKSEIQPEILNNVFVEHNLVTEPVSLEAVQDDVITLSDSDVSDCVEIPEKRELVVLSSDDECKANIKWENDGNSITNSNEHGIKTENSISDDSKNKNDDDIIFIEPEPKLVEVIEIDCDSVNVSLKDDEKHSETASTNSDNIKIPNVPSKRKRISKERRELCTPDSSASNDFLDSTEDLNQLKFNFSLHGPDFGSTNVSKTKAADASETDSTTSDATTSKANYFNVVDFEAPSKQFFEDANLESFGKYITPNRDKLKNVKNAGFEQVCTRATKRHNIATHDSSDSSSESDYDESKVNYLNSKRLPQLSTVHIETELVDKDDSFVVEEIPVGPKQMPEKYDAKRKSEDHDSSNKRHKLQEDGASGKGNVTSVADVQPEADCFVDDIDIGDHPDFIIIDATDDESVGIKNDTDDTESYFSCDEFNNITSDLTLGNCHTQKQGEGNGDVGSQMDKTSKTEKIDCLNYTIEEIHRTMSDDPNLWKILDIDRLHFRYVTPRGPRCHRCREIGHMALHCTNKRGRPACTLCGERTHAEPRCPMAMCTSCGRLGGNTTYCSYCAHWRNVQCNICKLYGHVESVCPDVWRRYHLTTKPGPIVKPAVQTLKPEKDRWCSGCAQSGHFESACTYYNRTHFAVYPEVLRYVDLYNFPKSQPYIIHQEEESNSETPLGKDDSLDTIESSDHFADLLDSDTEGHVVPEESFHDAETCSPDKVSSNVSLSKIEDVHMNETYFKIDFPPPNFIPPYFRSQMDYLKKHYLLKKSRKRDSSQGMGDESSTSGLQDMSSNSVKSTTLASLGEFTSNNSSETKENYKGNGGHVMYPTKSGYRHILKLDYLQFAYIHTKEGINFFNDIRRKPGIDILIDKYDDRDAGELCLSGQVETNVNSIKKDILYFLRKMPCIKNLPLESKDMLSFLLRQKDVLDKAEGNCWTLCKKLCKLTNIGGKDGCTPALVKLKTNIQVTIQLLLFGKLKLESGGAHLNKIQEWIKVIRDRPNFTLSLNDIFEIHQSYAYIFEPRRSIYPLRNLCARHDHYILPTVDSYKRRKMPQRNKIYIENKSKFVIETCKKFNLPNKFMTELIAIQNAMSASKYSRICYIDFLRFMSRFRTYIKKHKIL